MQQFEHGQNFSENKNLGSIYKSVDTFPLATRYEAVKMPIKYRVEGNEIRSNIVDFCRRFNSLQTELQAILGDDNIDPKEKEAKIIKTKEAIWKLMADTLPNNSGKKLSGLSHTKEDYYRVMTYHIPRHLAEYGVYAFPVERTTLKPNSSEILYGETGLNFSLVIKAQTSTKSVWGEDVAVNKIHIGEAIVNSVEEVREGEKISIQTIFQNIVVRDRENLRVCSNFIEQVSSMPDREGKSDDEIFELNKGHGSEIVVALQTAIEKCGSHLKKNGVNIADFIDRQDNHETGHLYNRKKGLFSKFNPVVSTDKLVSIAPQLEFTYHEEANGLLTDLKYSKKKHLAIMLMLSQVVPSAGQSISHSVGYIYVAEQMVATLMTDPDKFGIKIDQKKQISPKSQVVMQLADLPEREAQWNLLIDEVFNNHKKVYDKNLDEQLTGLLDIKQASSGDVSGLVVRNKDNSKMDKILTGSGLLATVAVGSSLYYLHRRKRRVQKELQFGDQLRNLIPKKDKDNRGLLQDLQLGENPAGVDKAKRLNAITMLTNYYKSNEQITEILDRIK